MIKLCKIAEQREDEVGILIKMYLINHVCPALCPCMRKSGSRPDAFNGNDVIGISRADCFVKAGID